MRVMNLPQLPTGPNSVEECIEVYVSRLSADRALWPRLSFTLTAYMAWPNSEPRRDSFIASYLASRIQNRGDDTSDAAVAEASESERTEFETFGGLGAVAKPALDHLTDEIGRTQREWLLVADIFHKVADIAHDDRVSRGGDPSISKAVELCEIERSTPGHSQLRRAWSDFRNVAHLLTASAHLAHGAIEKSAGEQASILNVVRIAPDAVLALAGGFQEFGLQLVRNKSTILPKDTLWQVPLKLVPEKPFIPVRRLTDDQLEYLQARGASKKYRPTTAPVRGQRQRTAD
jgi:hypothetical protein